MNINLSIIQLLIQADLKHWVLWHQGPQERNFPQELDKVLSWLEAEYGKGEDEIIYLVDHFQGTYEYLEDLLDQGISPEDLDQIIQDCSMVMAHSHFNPAFNWDLYQEDPEGYSCEGFINPSNL